MYRQANGTPIFVVEGTEPKAAPVSAANDYGGSDTATQYTVYAVSGYGDPYDTYPDGYVTTDQDAIWDAETRQDADN